MEKVNSLKEKTYAVEKMFFSPFATKSFETKGRLKDEPPCVMRTEFQRDRDRIIYCKSFIRLKNKTQVFFSPEGDHYITRLTHTLDVSQISRSIARALSLNEDLAEAIALGHDLGHTPFGHSGERILNKLLPTGFEHNVQSLRVVDVLEKDGKGLNLTYEVRDGILNHKSSCTPATLEGKCVSLADRIAYINHDLDDAIRAGILTAQDIPEDIISVLGTSSKERINRAITSIYENSIGTGDVKMDDKVEKASTKLREFMFDKVYLSGSAKGEESKAEKMLTAMFEHFFSNPELMPEIYRNIVRESSLEQAVCDYLSSMTDRYAVYMFNNIFVPKGWTFIDENK